MRIGAIVASIGFHAAVVGAMVWQNVPNASPRESVPIYFEIIEEAFASEDIQENPETLEIQETPESPVPPENLEILEKPEIPEVLETPKTLEILDSPKPLEVVNTIDAAPPPTLHPPSPPVAPPPQLTPPPSAANHAAIISPPTALNQITPVYPRSARRKGREGCVTLEIRVSSEGAVVDAAIIATSGFSDLDRAALDAAQSARFVPATEDDIPVEGSIRLTFDFKLK